jgi:uncharacterized protein (DUF1330 family)
MNLALSWQENAPVDTLLSATIAKTFFGAFPAEKLALHRSAGQVSATAVASDLDRAVAADKACVLVAFQMGEGHGAASLQQYVNDRDAALKKHGGRVYVSAVTPRSGDWNFDGFELIEFPRADTVQNLMADEQYRNGTKNSAGAFSGAFAMGILSPAA